MAMSWDDVKENAPYEQGFNSCHVTRQLFSELKAKWFDSRPYIHKYKHTFSTYDYKLQSTMLQQQFLGARKSTVCQATIPYSRSEFIVSRQKCNTLYIGQKSR